MFEIILFLLTSAVVFSVAYYKERANEKGKIPFEIRENKFR